MMELHGTPPYASVMSSHQSDSENRSQIRAPDDPQAGREGRTRDKPKQPDVRILPHSCALCTPAGASLLLVIIQCACVHQCTNAPLPLVGPCSLVSQGSEEAAPPSLKI